MRLFAAAFQLLVEQSLLKMLKTALKLKFLDKLMGEQGDKIVEWLKSQRLPSFVLCAHCTSYLSF